MVMFMSAFISITFVACSSNTSDSTDSTPTSTISYSYVGSSNSNKYHMPSCTWAKKINSSNLVEFTSVEDAESKGYQPCKVCKPQAKRGEAL